MKWKIGFLLRWVSLWLSLCKINLSCLFPNSCVYLFIDKSFLQAFVAQHTQRQWKTKSTSYGWGYCCHRRTSLDEIIPRWVET